MRLMNLTLTMPWAFVISKPGHEDDTGTIGKFGPGDVPELRPDLIGEDENGASRAEGAVFASGSQIFLGLPYGSKCDT